MTHPHAARAEARRLHGAWRDALAAYQRSDTDANYDAEDRAHDALIDYIEANGLNYTEFDPRGDDHSICWACGEDVPHATGHDCQAVDD